MPDTNNHTYILFNHELGLWINSHDLAKGYVRYTTTSLDAMQFSSYHLANVARAAIRMIEDDEDLPVEVQNFYYNLHRSFYEDASLPPSA